MKYLMFKNDSGDDAWAICVIDDVAISNDALEKVVKKNIGDDYDGEDIYGSWWIEEFTETKLSGLLEKNHD